MASVLVIVLGLGLAGSSGAKQPQNNIGSSKKVSLELIWHFMETDPASLLQPGESCIDLFMLSSTWAFER